MRELKFRAWDTEQECMLIFDIEWLSNNGTSDGDIIGMNGVPSGGYPVGSYEDIEIMQFTGLCDKNGKMVFEGDICDINNSVETIFWNEEFCRWDTEQRDGLEKAWDIEVIGNIYENPDILSEESA